MKKLFQNISSKKQMVTVIALLIMGILYYLPRFLMDGIPHYFQEDTFFHTSRIIGLQNVWQSPVNFLNFAHNGPAVNIFYPWLTMYPMYLFYRITGSYVLGYKFFYLFLTILTLFIAYSVMHRISKDRISAFVFAIFYTYSAYRFTNVFRRAHLPESICMTGMLFVLLGLYEVLSGDFRRWSVLSFGMAVIAYSHNTFLLIASISCGVLFFASIWNADRKKERIIAFCKAAGLAFVLSLGTILPILEYMGKNELYTPGGSGQGLAGSAYSLAANIVNSLRNEPVSYAVGLSVLVGVFCLITIRIYYIFSSGLSYSSDRMIDLFAVWGVFLFFAASSSLPWKQIGDHSPLYIIQFVWRLNSQITIFVLAPFAYYLPKIFRSKKARIMLPVLVCVFAVGLHYSAILKLHKEENTRILEADIASGDAITLDYAPLRAKRYRESHGYTLDHIYLNGEIIPGKVSYSQKGTVYTAVIDVPSSDELSVTVDIPVFWYLTQRCEVNDDVCETEISERGTTLVRVTPGQESTISISYHHTALTYAAWAISLAGMIIFIYFSVRNCIYSEGDGYA